MAAAPDKSSKPMRAALIGLVANVALAGAKLAAGIIGHSYALIADAIESLLTEVYNASAVDWSVFDAYSARESARVMAAAIDDAVERFAAQHRLHSN